MSSFSILARTVFALQLLIVTATLAGGAEPKSSDNWPNWRGPLGTGVAAEGNYPTQWSESDSVLWKVPLPGPGASTPVVWNDQIFVTLGDGDKNWLYCFGTDGQRQWGVESGKLRPGKHKKATGSNSSPLTDGEHVWAYFKSGDLLCCDMSGKTVWQFNLQSEFGEDTLWWDLGTSPVLCGDLIVIAVMQSGPSYLAAFQKETGKVVWKADRVLDAPNEANHSYTSPVVVQQNGKNELLTLGADHLTAHDGETGKLLWKIGGFNPEQQQYFRSIASPVVAGDLVICPYARGKTLDAFRWTGSGAPDSRKVWSRQDLGTDVPTPAYKNGKIYLAGDKGEFTCLDAKTGKELWSGELPKNRNAYSSSPIVAGGYIYLTREDSTTFVLKDGDKFELVATNPLEGSTVATLVPVNDRIYMRTNQALYCFGAK